MQLRCTAGPPPPPAPAPRGTRGLHQSAPPPAKSATAGASGQAGEELQASLLSAIHISLPAASNHTAHLSPPRQYAAHCPQCMPAYSERSTAAHEHLHARQEGGGRVLQDGRLSYSSNQVPCHIVANVIIDKQVCRQTNRRRERCDPPRAALQPQSMTARRIALLLEWQCFLVHKCLPKFPSCPAPAALHFPPSSSPLASHPAFSPG